MSVPDSLVSLLPPWGAPDSGGGADSPLDGGRRRGGGERRRPAGRAQLSAPPVPMTLILQSPHQNKVQTLRLDQSLLTVSLLSQQGAEPGYRGRSHRHQLKTGVKGATETLCVCVTVFTEVLISTCPEKCRNTGCFCLRAESIYQTLVFPQLFYLFSIYLAHDVGASHFFFDTFWEKSSNSRWFWLSHIFDCLSDLFWRFFPHNFDFSSKNHDLFYQNCDFIILKPWPHLKFLTLSSNSKFLNPIILT